MFILIAALGMFGGTEQPQNDNSNLLRAVSNYELEVARNWTSRVYLATYPRSGNHWMRYLIEEATGIATGSTNCDGDPPHLPDPFPWGGYAADHGYEGHCRYPQYGETVVIKTHSPAFDPLPFDHLPYYRTVRVVRH